MRFLIKLRIILGSKLTELKNIKAQQKFSIIIKIVHRICHSWYATITLMLHRNILRFYISPYELPKFKLLGIFYFSQMHLMYIDQISLFLLYSDHFEQKYVKYWVLGQNDHIWQFHPQCPRNSHCCIQIILSKNILNIVQKFSFISYEAYQNGSNRFIITLLRSF